MLPEKSADGADAFVPHVGGAVFNTAVALGRLEAEVGMFTRLSQDMFGRQLKDALDESGVDTAAIAHAGQPTTLAFVTLVDGQASYAFFDENSAGRTLGVSDLPELSEDISALFFGGISLACEPCGDSYATLCINEGGNRVVMMDPNIRAGFIADETRYRARLERMFSKADIVKVSDEDLDWLFPDCTDEDEQIARLQTQCECIVVITKGADGAVAHLPTGAKISVPGRQVKVADTIGAGDTFNAGVLARLAQLGKLTKRDVAELTQAEIEDVLGYGALVASFTVEQSGANPPWKAQLPS